MLNRCEKLVPSETVNSDGQITSLLWVLTNKTSGNRQEKIPRASSRSFPLFLHWNAPTLNLSSMRAMLGISVAWNSTSATCGDAGM